MRIPVFVSVLTSLGLLMTGCPKNPTNLDLSSEELKKKAVRQMRDEVFVDQYGQYQCWASGRKVVDGFIPGFGEPGVFGGQDLAESISVRRAATG